MAILGQAQDRDTGEKLTLELTPEQRDQGTYIIGTTGTGKSTVLRNIAVEDKWPYPAEGLCVLDPHGDLTDELLGWVPPERIKDVVYLNPMDLARPSGLTACGGITARSVPRRFVHPSGRRTVSGSA